MMANLEAHISVDTNTFEHHFVADDNFRLFVFRELNEMRKKDHLCDVVIVTDNGNRRFAAHRAILAASSRYFQKLYIGTTLARYSRETVLSGISEELLERLLDYIYTAEICISGENVRAILHAAYSLGMDLLIHECEMYLTKHLHSGNCIEMMTLAQNYSCAVLLQKSKHCICEHFLKLRNTQPFYRMPADQLQLVAGDDDLNITKEEEVYEALIWWIRYDYDRRKVHFETLLKYVRLSCLSRRYLVSSVEREPLVLASDFCKGLVSDALNLKLMEKRASSTLLSNKRKRRWRTYLMEAIVIVGGIMEDSVPEKCTNCYNPQTDKWYSLAKMRDDRLNFSMTRLGYWLIVSGGCSAKENLHVLSNAERFEPKFNKWVKIASMNQARFKCEAVEVNGKIYAIGGIARMESVDNFSAIECYDHVTDSWTQKSPPRQVRHTHCSAVLNGCIYIICGMSRCNTVLRSVERYDPTHDKWSTVAALNTPRSGACAAVLAGKIYVVGGTSNRGVALKTCEVYHAKQDKWFYCQDMCFKRDRADAATFGGKIYVVGGSYGNIVVDSVECYDPSKDKWKITTYLPHPRHGFRCCTAVVNRDLIQEVYAGKPAVRSEQLI